MGLIPGSGIYPGRGYSDPHQYSCLENLVDRGAWRATVYGATKSRRRWRQLSAHTVCVRVRRTQSLRARGCVRVCVCAPAGRAGDPGPRERSRPEPSSRGDSSHGEESGLWNLERREGSLSRKEENGGSHTRGMRFMQERHSS